MVYLNELHVETNDTKKESKGRQLYQCSHKTRDGVLVLQLPMECHCLQGVME